MLTNLSTALRQKGLLTFSQEESLIEQVKASGISMPEALLSSGLFTSSELAEHLSSLFGLNQPELSQYEYASLCQQLGLRELITRHNALPLQRTSSTLLLAVADPTNQQAEDDFRFATGLQVELVLGDFSQLSAAIRRLYGRSLSHEKSGLKEINQEELANLVDVGADEIDNIEDLSQDESPVSRYINQILLDAVRKGASDIHFEPYEKMYRVRLRCDGILIETQQPPSHLSRRLSARIKILSKLDIAERRLPQDGRIKLKLNQDTAIDMRVSTLPTLFGEKIVLRLLDSSSASLDIDKLGYSEQQKQLYLDALRRPQGMILMTGPTGSGKTVSLYTGLSILNKPEINISTAEDPVEINLSGINQVQVQPKIGFGFAEALRSFLRQDPDVVMVGEIRDLDTAEIAIKASQTGHLVLSTLHTNSAAETVIRLSNMGVESFNLASSLSLIIAQRLARKLCSHCKQSQELTVQLQHLGIQASDNIFKANPDGCNECTHGYSGRTGIYEVMRFDEFLSEALIKGASVHELEKLAIANGMSTLQMSGIEKLKQGITSFSELQRVLYF
ncbi:TPA: type IV-A pilus assembly ATPase PilB [Vibrio alginolyticus]|jgi:type IV pilus assembly protein PilB|uniref:Type IV-A pilus assembly ATPase PilB n=1 Tax=Vibrio alginolyticus TaxID=663 RepID=A0A7Y4EXE7_VIBAL|nr:MULTISPECIES: type IV-A pilus assembly ATPase PilB [Vibrio]EJE3287754.1 type IV-A pilus assembly ATPase PilB [Vibrio alginolyticus]EJN3360989.1 type IV-A pilus assembly ATPase PilB [Vibrio alginolyticus]EJS0373127.1 type IV-A pilus assembly ATPase PilB [Vibrio alginolyticus]ELA7388151.1 type IV-A pilus assembly ATPase PilB [Vibrio alginolyticus]ELE6600198.1 type IV-A pilus assembly ATPase PilB [Vibrio alginolyticus]